ncbi:MAG: response regulator [Proteobacteria bacterium]|nr:response regulator [Pseudomonadota bacterium]
MGVKNSIPKVLLVEDNPEDAKLVKRSLNGEFQMVCVDSLKEAEAQLGKEDFEIILLDLTLPDSDGLPTLGKVREMAPDVPIVVITAAEDREMAVRAVRQGAQDYLFKGTFDALLLQSTLRHGIERQKILEELERSNKELGRFAYIVSHDLQSPLRGVSTFAEILAADYKGKLDKDADECIDIIVKCASKAQLLISELLTFSRVQSKEQTFKRLCFEEVFENTVDNLAVSIKEARAKITHDPLPDVVADYGQMVQLMENLVANALKFKGKQPPRVHISAKKSDGDWVFSVRDNGIGIPEKDFGKIFEVFQKLHGKDEYSGTGIGLAICKKIIDRHQGRIWVESAPGKGSVFKFTLSAELLEK